MKRVLVLLLAGAPAFAAGPALYPDLPSFKADAARAFARVRALTGMSQVVLHHIDEDGETRCEVGAAAVQAEFSSNGDRTDAIFVCPGLRTWAANEKQIFFVMAHEMAHLKLRHNTLQAERFQEHLEEWARSHPWGEGQTLEGRMTAARAEIDELMAPFKLDLEVEADKFALDLMVQEGIHPAHASFVLERGAGFEGRSPALAAVLRRRNEGILSRVPEFIRTLPARPAEGFFP